MKNCRNKSLCFAICSCQDDAQRKCIPLLLWISNIFLLIMSNLDCSKCQIYWQVEPSSTHSGIIIILCRTTLGTAQQTDAHCIEDLKKLNVLKLDSNTLTAADVQYIVYIFLHYCWDDQCPCPLWANCCVTNCQFVLPRLPPTLKLYNQTKLPFLLSIVLISYSMFLWWR